MSPSRRSVRPWRCGALVAVLLTTPCAVLASTVAPSGAATPTDAASLLAQAVSSTVAVPVADAEGTLQKDGVPDSGLLPSSCELENVGYLLPGALGGGGTPPCTI